MPMAERTATTGWDGDLAHGNGSRERRERRARATFTVTWASRTQRSDGKTSPEELIAAAHSSLLLDGARARAHRGRPRRPSTST